MTQHYANEIEHKRHFILIIKLRDNVQLKCENEIAD